MQIFPKTVIWRHRKENLRKCSLRHIEDRPDFQFIRYPNGTLPDLTHYILLQLDAPPLTAADCDHGLFVIDATWRYAEKMVQRAHSIPSLIPRSIPEHYRTAYPRRQEDCQDPERGLASIEAIFIAYHILNRDLTGLLEGYHWKDSFMQKNGLGSRPDNTYYQHHSNF